MNPELNQTETAASKEEKIKINGFRQVVEMLKIADPEFRESILRRLAARDPHLANQIRRDLLKE